MSTRRPPRREPRVLAVRVNRRGATFACVDPWEVRSSGTAPVRPGHEIGALRRLVAREKPTAVVLDGALRRKIDPLDLAVPVLSTPRERPSIPLATELFAELATFAPTPALCSAVLLAIAAVLAGGVPPRHYASPRPRPLPPRS